MYTMVGMYLSPKVGGTLSPKVGGTLSPKGQEASLLRGRKPLS